jgi:hypothetical protein
MMTTDGVAMQYQTRYRDYDPQWWPHEPPVLSTWHVWFVWTPKSDGWEYAEQHNGRAWIAYRRRPVDVAV